MDSTMPDEITVNEILETVSFHWLDRLILSALLRAFDIKPIGKRINPKGGRPAVTYNTDRIMKMLTTVDSHRGDDQ